MLGRQPEQGFERNMAVEAAIVTKNEFVEISVEVPAAQAVIRAKAPSLQQCENSVNPWQDNMSRHFADHVDGGENPRIDGAVVSLEASFGFAETMMVRG